MRSDLFNNIHPIRALSPVAAATSNAAIVSQIIDTANFDSLTFLISIGANTDTDALFAVLIEDGENSGLSDAAAVDDKFLLGTEALAGFRFDDDNETRKIGYIGSKRYVRLTITPSLNDAGNIFVSATAVLGHPRNVPTPNPPV